MNESEVLTAGGLRKLAAAEGPCITLVLPWDATSGPQIRLKDAIRGLEAHPDVKSLLADVTSIGEHQANGKKNGSLIVLRSPDVFEHFMTEEPAAETVSVDEHFQIRPILALAGKQKLFYMLALSQRHVRVLKCTQNESEEVPLPHGMPVSLDDSKQTSKPDHDLDNRSTGGPSTGSMKGVMFGTTTDREDKDQYLLHFMSEIDKGVHALLRDSKAPLIAVGVEHELALYRQVNTYPNLVEPGVHGAPDGLKGGEMHKRALELLEATTPAPLQKALDGFDKSVGTGHASVHAQEIVRAAYEGRVSHLLFQESAEYSGSFDEVRQRVKRDENGTDQKHDLINAAAVQTLLHGGEVSVLPANKMPNGVPVAAIFRYANTTIPTSAS